jgi:hypothetical protein
VSIQASRLLFAFALTLSVASPAVAASFDSPYSRSDSPGQPAFADWMLENIWGRPSAILISTDPPVQTVTTVGIGTGDSFKGLTDPPAPNASSVTFDPIGSHLIAADAVAAPEPASVLMLFAGAMALGARLRAQTRTRFVCNKG